jgi:hypothetical protein
MPSYPILSVHYISLNPSPLRNTQGGADIQSKVEEPELVNQSLRNRDKVKDDAIAQLSDQLMALSTRLQEVERRQQLA